MASTSDKKSPSGSRNPHMVGEKFKVNKKIGEGSFGVIYEGKHIIANLRFINQSSYPQLKIYHAICCQNFG